MGYCAEADITITGSISGYMDYPVRDIAFKITSACCCAYFQKGQIPSWLPRFILELMEEKTRAHQTSAP